jgi:hypothetical protein
LCVCSLARIHSHDISRYLEQLRIDLARLKSGDISEDGTGATSTPGVEQERTSNRKIVEAEKKLGEAQKKLEQNKRELRHLDEMVKWYRYLFIYAHCFAV